MSTFYFVERRERTERWAQSFHIKLKKKVKFTALHSALDLFNSLKSFGEKKETILSISEKI